VRRQLAVVLGSLAALLSACGERQEQPPDVFAVDKPRGARQSAFREAGMELERPKNWKLRRRDPPGVFEILSGEAIVSGWAYPREEPLPATDAQLEAARKRLVEAIEQRDPSFKVSAAKTTEMGGSLAIDVRGRQVISRRTVQTRSVHVFEGEVEYVFEALAPPDSFARTAAVLAQVLRSVELTGAVAGAEE